MCLFWPQNTFCLILSLFLFQKVKTVVFPFFGMFSTEPFHVQSIAPRQRFFISQNKLQNQNVNFALKYRENMTWWAYSIWKYNIFFRFDVCSHKIVAIWYMVDSSARTQYSVFEYGLHAWTYRNKNRLQIIFVRYLFCLLDQSK